MHFRLKLFLYSSQDGVYACQLIDDQTFRTWNDLSASVWLQKKADTTGTASSCWRKDRISALVAKWLIASTAFQPNPDLEKSKAHSDQYDHHPISFAVCSVWSLRLTSINFYSLKPHVKTMLVKHGWIVDFVMESWNRLLLNEL